MYTFSVKLKFYICRPLLVRVAVKLASSGAQFAKLWVGAQFANSVNLWSVVEREMTILALETMTFVL